MLQKIATRFFLIFTLIAIASGYNFAKAALLPTTPSPSLPAETPTSPSLPSLPPLPTLTPTSIEPVTPIPVVIGTSTATATQKEINKPVDTICGAVSSKIDAKVSDFENKFAKHLLYYKGQREELQMLIAKLKAKKVSSSKLGADLVLLDIKIKKFQDDKSGVITALASVKMAKCAKSATRTKDAITAAQNAEKLVYQDAKDVLSFINNDILTDVKTIKSSKK